MSCKVVTSTSGEVVSWAVGIYQEVIGQILSESDRVVQMKNRVVNTSSTCAHGGLTVVYMILQWQSECMVAKEIWLRTIIEERYLQTSRW